MLGVCLFVCSICAMNIQSIPYMAPLSPFSPKAMLDVLIRADWRKLWKQKFRVQNVPGSQIASHQPDSKEE